MKIVFVGFIDPDGRFSLIECNTAGIAVIQSYGVGSLAEPGWRWGYDCPAQLALARELLNRTVQEIGFQPDEELVRNFAAKFLSPQHGRVWRITSEQILEFCLSAPPTDRPAPYPGEIGGRS